MTADAVNATYELLGCIAIGASCYRVHKDKQVKGVSLVTVGFFTSWGFWNLYYYPHIGQLYSGIGAAITCATNCLWVYLIVKYRSKK